MWRAIQSTSGWGQRREYQLSSRIHFYGSVLILPHAAPLKLSLKQNGNSLGRWVDAPRPGLAGTAGWWGPDGGREGPGLLRMFQSGDAPGNVIDGWMGQRTIRVEIAPDDEHLFEGTEPLALPEECFLDGRWDYRGVPRLAVPGARSDTSACWFADEARLADAGYHPDRPDSFKPRRGTPIRFVGQRALRWPAELGRHASRAHSLWRARLRSLARRAWVPHGDGVMLDQDSPFANLAVNMSGGPPPLIRMLPTGCPCARHALCPCARRAERVARYSPGSVPAVSHKWGLDSWRGADRGRRPVVVRGRRQVIALANAVDGIDIGVWADLDLMP
jgi:hypothetical protein